MKFLKNLLAFVFVVGILGYTGYLAYIYYVGNCGRTLEYSIGRFDSKFGLSKEDFKSYVALAEKPWEEALTKNVFVYNPAAKFKVNLIYDERQQATELKQKTEFGLTRAEEIFQKLDAEFSLMKFSYDAKVRAYEEALRVFKQRQKDYEGQVQFWNAKNGAPKNEYEKLQQEQSTLNQEASRLNNEALLINNLTKELNALLEKRNLAADEYNKTARSYNQKYGHGLEFNQAEYNGEAINVYQFGNKNDLILALAHEFGHALSMDHVENPKSIMYYVTANNTDGSLSPSTEDLGELRRVCRI